MNGPLQQTRYVPITIIVTFTHSQIISIEIIIPNIFPCMPLHHNVIIGYIILLVGKCMMIDWPLGIRYMCSTYSSERSIPHRPNLERGVNRQTVYSRKLTGYQRAHTLLAIWFCGM